MARLTPFAVWSVVKELRETARDRDAIVVTGAPALAEALRRELGRGAKPGAVREGSLSVAWMIDAWRATGPVCAAPANARGALSTATPCPVAGASTMTRS